MNDTVLRITYSPIEATFLASLLGADMLLGIQDPFLGWLTEEIEDAWNQARSALAERHFIEEQPDGSIVMDTAAAALIGTWAFPEASFLVTFTPLDDSPQICSFHLTRNLAVEQAQVSDAIQLTALEDAQAVYWRILEMMRLKEKDLLAAPVPGVKLSESHLRAARARAVEVGEKGALEALREAGLPENTAQSLASTLAKPVANSALTALARRSTTWEASGLGLLEGTNGLWLLRSFARDRENWVELVPCDAVQARQEVRQVMNRVLPEPLVGE